MDVVDAVLQRQTVTHRGGPVDFEIPVSAYPCNSGRLLLISPGSGELKDGRHDRWRKLALHLQELGLCATVTYNAPRPDFEVQLEWEAYSYRGASWNRILIESVCHVAEWALDRSTGLCGSEAPAICMAGFSSGGSAVGAVAYRYPLVEQLLLLSSYDSVGDPFYEGISLFTGDIFMGYGSQDPPAGMLAYVISVGPLSARSMVGRPVPDCDHRFSGADNSRALVKAVYWALGHDDSFPNPAGAPQLYE
ncbi:hypothetical protein GBAR_LOCUS11466 [Geodia barretti]|uniref:Alpha/beta hydrolase n=1 Tax=Geodia barretti TaxID=519541 RepID=A0AA35RY05_GEOBA|nr:hypothetical protein GBAR_LOCUS11466 [Geodia barretti]